eukprot:CAMPEP_0197534214 /NCGR_PEP_ID=MMETSP1318-20131121/46356_1 /TAXON_ID=552666 /ORGANISM="Partenskyella glossopodia, Strain RCC365" /LENGTH=537 /DNA_ID=CAMNT_0043091397 /DNA_START=45 /DNA_END=1658 /DNA_ORIENTATION=-
MTDLRGHMNTTAPPACEFEVEVIDRERPKFTGWGDIPRCAAHEIGVAEYEQCFGKHILVTKNETNFRHNVEYSLEDIDNECCAHDMTCLPYKGSQFISICQEGKMDAPVVGFTNTDGKAGISRTLAEDTAMSGTDIVYVAEYIENPLEQPVFYWYGDTVPGSFYSTAVTKRDFWTSAVLARCVLGEGYPLTIMSGGSGSVFLTVNDDPDFKLFKLDSDLNTIWEQTYREDKIIVQSIAIDTAENVISVGFCAESQMVNGSEVRFDKIYATKHSSDGTQLWTQTFSSSLPTMPTTPTKWFSVDVKIDADGNIWAIGNIGPPYWGCLFKINSETGVFSELRTFSSYSYSVSTHALLIDGDNIYIGGTATPYVPAHPATNSPTSQPTQTPNLWGFPTDASLGDIVFALKVDRHNFTAGQSLSMLHYADIQFEGMYMQNGLVVIGSKDMETFAFDPTATMTPAVEGVGGAWWAPVHEHTTHSIGMKAYNWDATATGIPIVTGFATGDTVLGEDSEESNIDEVSVTIFGLDATVANPYIMTP